ncbi:MAG: hypothetical protein ACFFFH_04910 [Candidatus Thorarchaeota archaeon]
MSHQPLITHEELTLTIEYLNYNGPISSDFPLDYETERKQGLSKVVASSAF